MLRRKRLFIVSAVVLVFALSFLFNPFFTIRIFSPQSCTISVQPIHIMFIRYVVEENLTGTQVVYEGDYVICYSHPDSKAYGCYSTNCYGDNGTFVLTGQRFTTYDGTFYDNTEWEPKVNYFGVLISDNVINGSAATVIFPLIVIVMAVFGSILLAFILLKGREKHSPVKTELASDAKV